MRPPMGLRRRLDNLIHLLATQAQAKPDIDGLACMDPGRLAWI